jgi:hypothetical protein
MFTSTDGVALEGRMAIPDHAPPRGGAILCHPHPQYGGSMSTRLIPALQRALVAAGWAALRFNFRGVGRSEGSYGGGVDEVNDAIGALARLRESVDPPHAVVGFSFGALVALNAVARDRGVDTFAGIAPPGQATFAGRFELPPIADLDGWEARTLLVCGTEDPYCRSEDLRRLAGLIPAAEVRVVDGADHLFTAQTDEVCSLVATFVTGG